MIFVASLKIHRINNIIHALQDAKDVVNSSKLWKRLQPMMSSSGNNSPSKKSDSEDLSSIKLRKVNCQ